MKPYLNRRNAIRSLLGGSLVMPSLLSQLLHGGEGSATKARSAQYQAKAKRVIWVYLTGGFSHVDTFDPKPKLIKDHGNSMSTGRGPQRYLSRPKWEYKPGGRCGTMVSDLFPNVRDCMDDICLVRSMHADHGNHFEATLQMHTGSFSFARPSIGSWVSYGLGTENENLPSFVVLAPHLPYAGGQVWSNDMLPGVHQGVRVLPGAEPIANLKRRAAEQSVQDLELSFLKEFNQKHLKTRQADANLAARIQSFETAFGMQMEAPEAFDLSRETDATLGLYGLERGSSKGFAWQCLVARRLAERGVRFIELIDTGASNNWDSHSNMDEHNALARNVDRPIAGLLKDLKSRGLLDETLVVCTTEFGRTPYTDRPSSAGREHHKEVFSSWLAGGGVKAGSVYGTSDDIGNKVETDGVHVHDFHATILHLLGMDHERLTYHSAGRDFRLTDVAGRVVPGLIG